VATVAVDGAANAGYLAAAVLAVGDARLEAALGDYRESLQA
jgi:phosphoribosylcarboxyaminoimidazole (NCAIR) mutase